MGLMEIRFPIVYGLQLMLWYCFNDLGSDCIRIEPFTLSSKVWNQAMPKDGGSHSSNVTATDMVLSVE